MAFVVSAGSLAGLTRPALSRASSVKLTNDLTLDYAALWRSQGAVRTVVDFLGRNIASLGLHQFERVSDTDRKRVTDTGLAQLLGKPNPYTTTYRLMDALVRDFGIYDRAYWLKVRMTGTDQIQGLLRLPPSRVEPVGDNWMWPDAFEFRGDKGKRSFAASDVVYFRGYDPDGDRGGSSPIESLRRVLAEEYEAGRMREATLRNGARMSGYITRPATAPAWSDTAANRFRQAWRSQYAGASGSDVGGTPVLEDGMSFVSASQTAEQLQYVEARKLTREEVAAAYFIPPTMVGIMDSATFSNIKEQHKHLYQDTLGPWLQMIAQEIELQLLPDFPDSKGTYLEFNLAEKLRGSFEEQAAQLQTSTGGPFMTRNEARALSNLPAIEGGDELIVPLNVITGGQASPTDSAPTDAVAAGPAPRLARAGAVRVKADEETDPDEGQRDEGPELFRAFFRRQRESVLASLHGAKLAGVATKADPAWWDGERWNRELTADIHALAMSVSAELGAKQAAALGFTPDDYDVDRTKAFLLAVAESRAEWVNAATFAALQDVLAADPEDEDAKTPEDVFTEAEDVRSGSAGRALVTTAASFALIESGRQLAPDRATKTWRTTSDKPRNSHKAMNGQTVGINEKFSNGLDWPGDPVKGPDEVAGCECSVDVTTS